MQLHDALEVEVQLQDTAIEGTLEALLVRILPFLVDDPESEIFVWRSDLEVQDTCIVIAWFALDPVRGRFRNVDQIWAEDGKPVRLNNLWRRVVNAVSRRISPAMFAHDAEVTYS